MRKTLLLVFIHGFKGTDNTFEKFPEHLRVLVSEDLPKLNVQSVVYPQYETRGNLKQCVAKFKEWLQDRVIDLEVAAHAPSPTVDPSVRVILVGHSMGGIVAAETLLSIARDQPVQSDRSSSPPPGVGNSTQSAAPRPRTKKSTTANLSVPENANRSSSAPPSSTRKPPAATGPTSNPDEGTSDPSDTTTTLLFPYIQGVLAFDTPYLGINPGVVAHGAETHYNTATAAVSAYSQASKFFGWGDGNKSGGAGAGTTPRMALPSAGDASAMAAKSGSSWGKYAMFAGGAAALAAAGGAAWVNRDQISSGWSWVGSHLEFVGCLARGAELTQRVDAVVKLGEKCDVGFADFYARLPADESKGHYTGKLLGEDRTFCVVPVDAKTTMEDAPSPQKKRKVDQQKEAKAKSKGTWIECVNKRAGDEITAHRAMFTPRQHPGYYSMSNKAKDFVVYWVNQEWYDGSDDAPAEDADGGAEEQQDEVDDEGNDG